MISRKQYRDTLKELRETNYLDTRSPNYRLRQCQNNDLKINISGVTASYISMTDLISKNIIGVDTAYTVVS